MEFDAASRNFGVALLLTLSGGFLDAFAYVGHGHVFANTMTGNVALLGVNLAEANWSQAARHIPPLIAFVVAVFVAHMLKLASGRQWITQPALACLILEIVFLALAASGLVLISDFWLIPGITFVATLQTLSFTHLENLSYTSVMTTGNLRRAALKLFEGVIPKYTPTAVREARLLGSVSFCFLAGAVIGAFSVARFNDHALWIAVGLLASGLIRTVILAGR